MVRNGNLKEPAKEAVIAGSKWNRDLDVAHPTHTRRGRRQFMDLRHIDVKGYRHPIVNCGVLKLDLQEFLSSPLIASNTGTRCRRRLRRDRPDGHDGRVGATGKPISWRYDFVGTALARHPRSCLCAPVTRRVPQQKRHRRVP